SVTAICLSHPRVAVTVAPGSGRPANFTTPWCSAAAKRITASSAIALILRCLLHMIDNENLDRRVCFFELQPELLLKGRKNRRAAGRRSVHRVQIRRPLECKIVRAG